MGMTGRRRRRRRGKARMRTGFRSLAWAAWEGGGECRDLVEEATWRGNRPLESCSAAWTWKNADEWSVGRPVRRASWEAGHLHRRIRVHEDGVRTEGRDGEGNWRNDANSVAAHDCHRTMQSWMNPNRVIWRVFLGRTVRLGGVQNVYALTTHHDIGRITAV